MNRIAWILALLAAFAPIDRAQAETAVEKHGRLHVQGNRIVDKNGAPVQLRGMSLYWSQWIPKYYNAATIQWLRDDWKITVIRAAMAVKPNGYEKNPAAERDKVIAVVDAAIKLGLYVVIDYHAHTAHENRAQAQAFFADMARRYGNTPNVFTIYNEPLDVSWADVLRPYHEAVIEFDSRTRSRQHRHRRHGNSVPASGGSGGESCQAKQRGLHAALYANTHANGCVTRRRRP